MKHGNRYHIRVRGGLPSADGETLAHPAELDVYIRDRSPWVGFAGNAYVLPAGNDATLPITSINTDKAKATIYRIGERSLAGIVRDGTFLRNLGSYSASNIADETGEKVWEGEVEINSKLNQTVTTAIPIAKVVPDLKPGVYVITAAAPDATTDEYSDKATQWFVVSDLGLTTLSGHDGIHVMVRSLSSAEPVAGVKLQLIATNNDILGEATTDDRGYAHFDPGLARGTGGNAPQLVDASTTAGDFAFIDLTRAAFDLSDRGVTGRPAPEPLDVFLTPERGIYRPGETVHLTALVRDTQAKAVNDLPMTLVVDRPDGVEYSRATLSDGGLGGYSADVPLDANAMRGAWTVKIFADPKGNSLAETTVLVEDFEPDRLAFTLSTDAKSVSADKPATINLEAKYLYGATAPNLSVEGDVVITPVDKTDAYPGTLSASLTTTPRPTARRSRPTRRPTRTARPRSSSPCPTCHRRPGCSAPRRSSGWPTPMAARSSARSACRWRRRGRASASSRSSTATCLEGQPARFDVMLMGPDGGRVAGKGLTWKLERLESDYQWYREGSTWKYELITKTSRVGAGTIDVAADQPVAVSSPVDYGRYRFTVSRDGDDPAATSVEFYAGWYAPSASSDTPDVLKVGLDKAAYKIGDTAKLRLDPQFAGIALVTVMDDRLIDMKAVEVPADGTTVDLPVTDKWGPGAYVTATLYRPMDVAAKRMPARALGLAWAKVAPGDRQLDVSFDLPDEMRPRQPMTIPVSITNLKPGSEAYVTVAAVDVGILNLTNFKAPAPDDWYFGQRKLGMEIRDLYGLLIDRMQGELGAVRSGGDSGAVRLQSPPPTQKLVAYLFRHREGRRQRQGHGLLRPARLQRHGAGHGHGLVEGRHRPCGQGRDRPRSGGGDDQHSALPRLWRHLAAAGRGQQPLRPCRRLPAFDRRRRWHRHCRGRQAPHAVAGREAEGLDQRANFRQGDRRQHNPRRPRRALRRDLAE